MIPQDFIQQLLARVDIVDIVGRHVKLRRAGANFLGLCPFHGEKSPSFTVSPAKQFYHCFGCGAHGSAIGFLMEHAGLGYVEAIRDLAREAGMAVPEVRAADAALAAAAASAAASLGALLEASARFYRRCLRDSPRAIDYLKGRGLTGETAARFGIGYAPAQWRALEAAVPDYSAAALFDAGLVIEPDRDSEDSGSETTGSETTGSETEASGSQANGSGGHAARPETGVARPVARGRRYDRFRDRIMFPIRNARGQVIGFGGRVLDKSEPKYMNSPETAVFSKGREIYGLFEGREAIRREDCVIVVEGYMDVVMLAQHGVGNAVATLGTATTSDHVRKLIRLADRVVFAFDGDAAGQRAAWRALGVCLPHTSDTRRIDFLFLPPEHDPDSFVRERGEAGWRAQLASAVPLSELLLRELSARVDRETSEGRAMLLAQARPMISELAAPGLKMQLVHRLAELTLLSVDEVERYLAIADRASGADRATGRGAASNPASARSGDSAQRARSAPGFASGAARESSGVARRPAGGVRVRVSAPDLDARVKLLLALHPGLAQGVDRAAPGLSPSLLEWVSALARLPAGSTFANSCELLRELDAGEVDRLERASGADTTALAEMSPEEAGLELNGALAQLHQRWVRQQIDQLVADGVTTDEDRVRYQSLLKMSRSLLK